MKTVLVVEDEMKIARVVRDYLTDAGFEVIVASSGEAALASARGSKPDLVVLDLGLPGVDGLDVARELRGSSRVPIVMLTARGEETDKIVGLELGADDYVVKPFSPKELVARVRAVLRRSSTAEMLREQPIRVADVEIDPQRLRVTRAVGRSSSRRRSSSSWPRSRASPGGCSRADSCSTRSTASRSSPTSGRSTPT